FLQRFLNLYRVLTRHCAEAELGGSAARNNGLRAWTGIAAPHAIDVACWPCPKALQHAVAGLTYGLRKACLSQKARLIEIERGPGRALAAGERRDVIIEACEPDASIRAMKLAKNLR